MKSVECLSVFPRATLGEEKTSPLLRKRNSSHSKFFCAFAFVPSLFPVMKFCFLLGKKTARREKKTLVFPTQSPLVSLAVLGKRKSCEQFRLRQFIYLISSIRPGKQEIFFPIPLPFKFGRAIWISSCWIQRPDFFEIPSPSPSPSYNQYAVERRNPILSPSDLPREEWGGQEKKEG